MRPRATALAILLLLTGCDGLGLGVSGEDLLVEPEALDFGMQEVGRVVGREVSITNLSRSAVELSLRVDPGTEGATFGVDPEELRLEAGTTGTVLVEYLPVLGASEATLVLAHRGKTLESLPVSGSGAIPTLRIEPEAIDFELVLIGTAESIPFAVRNEGPILARFTPRVVPAEGAFALGSTPDAIELAVGDEVELDLRFAPSVEGVQGGWLELVPCTGCEVVRAALEGEGIRSGLVLSPSSLDFGAVTLGEARTLPLELRNLSNVELSFDLAPASGGPDALAFEIGEGPWVISPRSSHEIPVTFAPTEERAYAALLGWTSTDPRSRSGSLPLLGSGGGPEPLVLPTRLDFGEAALATRRQAELVVSNTGTSVLRLESAAFSTPEAFSLLTPLPLAVEPGALERVEVAFEPGVPGAHTSTLQLETNDIDTPRLEIPLTGTGIVLPACEVEVHPPALTFGVSADGWPLRRQIVVRNGGLLGDCLVADWRISGADAGTFTLDGPIGGSARLAPGERLVFGVEATLPEVGSFSALWTAYVSRPGEDRISVPLTAHRVDTELFVAPAPLDFGAARPGCVRAERSVCLHDAGNLGARVLDAGVSTTGPADAFFLSALPPELGTPAGYTLGAGESLCVGVSYLPTVPSGSEYGALRFEVEGQPGPFVVGLRGLATSLTGLSERFSLPGAAPGPKATLFVVDVSASMYAEEGSFVAGAPIYFDRLSNSSSNYAIAVTNMETIQEGGRFHPLDDARPRVVTPALADPRGAFLATVAELAATNLFNSELGMEATFLAFSTAALTTTNQGFLSPEGPLHIVFVSDNDDWSPRDDLLYAHFLEALVGREVSSLTVSAVVTPPEGCPLPSDTTELVGHRYIGLAGRFGGIVRPVCSEADWSETMTALADVSTGSRWHFPLSDQPVPASIAVFVEQRGGQRLPLTGWIHDPARNSVDFPETGPAPEGEAVVIEYEPICL
ncbi:MAG: choice-of-anchor D domain-containing protein [Deltaproteobacteria bacterium]|nr:choice-of-anchor D domain-containing protein [Deltaproteobacteria bacterium]